MSLNVFILFIYLHITIKWTHSQNMHPLRGNTVQKCTYCKGTAPVTAFEPFLSAHIYSVLFSIII